MMNRARATVAAVVLSAGVVLSGCAQAPSFDPDAAATFQERVLEVSTAASTAEFDAALQMVAELEVEVKDALARGLITPERHDSILAAIALVRADLEAAIAAQQPPPPPPAPEPEPPASNQGPDNNGNGNGNGNDDDDEDENNKGNNGNNGNNGNGKGNKDDD
jgi:hypothetical protein